MALAVRATSTFTDASPANGETVTVGGKVYTFETTLTNVNGNVWLGANAAAAHANLAAAINLTGTAGTQYATAMTINPDVKALTGSATTTVVEAKVPGTVGNFIATTETAGSGAWTGSVLAGGTGCIETDVDTILSACQVPSDILGRLLPLSSTRV